MGQAVPGVADAPVHLDRRLAHAHARRGRSRPWRPRLRPARPSPATRRPPRPRAARCCATPPWRPGVGQHVLHRLERADGDAVLAAGAGIVAREARGRRASPRPGRRTSPPGRGCASARRRRGPRARVCPSSTLSEPGSATTLRGPGQVHAGAMARPRRLGGTGAAGERDGAESRSDPRRRPRARSTRPAARAACVERHRRLAPHGRRRPPAPDCERSGPMRTVSAPADAGAPARRRRSAAMVGPR